MTGGGEEKDPNDVGTTGHSWDGIEELNNPLPRWWLWIFYATIVWGVLYTIAYPAWPLIDRATGGLLGYSTRAEVAEAIEAHEALNADLAAVLSTTEPGLVPDDAELHGYAVARGAAVYRSHCSQCHGAGAAGTSGYPNLLDDDWLWGGDIEDIALTVRHGIRNVSDPAARWSEMPSFGGILDDSQITAVVAYVQSLGAEAPEGVGLATGAQVYADSCAGCHGEQGEGMRDLGAPNLADAIWLYGGDADSIEYSVRHSRFGVMPPWGGRLSEADINAVAAYVHALGGGE